MNAETYAKLVDTVERLKVVFATFNSAFPSGDNNILSYRLGSVTAVIGQELSVAIDELEKYEIKYNIQPGPRDE